jgi:hypothetical protein
VNIGHEIEQGSSRVNRNNIRSVQNLPKDEPVYNYVYNSFIVAFIKY